MAVKNRCDSHRCCWAHDPEPCAVPAEVVLPDDRKVCCAHAEAFWRGIFVAAKEERVLNETLDDALFASWEAHQAELGIVRE